MAETGIDELFEKNQIYKKKIAKTKLQNLRKQQELIKLNKSKKQQIKNKKSD